LAKFIEQEASIYLYVLVYSLGSGVLYFFTALTEAPLRLVHSSLGCFGLSLTNYLV